LPASEVLRLGLLWRLTKGLLVVVVMPLGFLWLEKQLLSLLIASALVL
jgi:hypothetical protein